MRGTVQLVLPGLFNLPLQELEPDLLSRRLPHLNRILRLAMPQPNLAYSVDAILQASLGFEQSTDASWQGLPMAQAFDRKRVHKPERLLLSQAIHLQPDLHSAVIVPIQINQRNSVDLNNIIKDLNDLFKVDCYIENIATGLYLLRLEKFDAPTHYPHILSVLGKNANPYIDQSRRDLRWYKLLNEIQMFMHQHEINQQRILCGLLPINSFWFWGAGNVSQVLDPKPGWFCDDPVLNRFAESLGLTPESCSALGANPEPANIVVVDLRVVEFLKTTTDTGIDQLLLDIDSNLLKPIATITSRGHKKLVLRAGYEVDFELKPSAKLKFWRQRKNLSSWTR